MTATDLFQYFLDNIKYAVLFSGSAFVLATLIRAALKR